MACGFDVDGRARGGLVSVGKFGLFFDGSPSDPLFTADVSVSAPQKKRGGYCRNSDGFGGGCGRIVSEID